MSRTDAPKKVFPNHRLMLCRNKCKVGRGEKGIPVLNNTAPILFPQKLGMKMPLCSRLLEIFRELDAGKRPFGQQNYDRRYSLWTGDLGVAVYLWDCINGGGKFPTMDVF